MSLILEKLGFKKDILLQFKANLSEISPEKVIFKPQLPAGRAETIFCLGKISVLSDCYYQFNPNNDLVKQVIVFSSAFELMAYYQLYNSFCNQAVLVAIGSRPDKTTVKMIKGNFKDARIALVMGNSFFGRLNDIRIACILKGFEPSVSMLDGNVIISAGKYHTQIHPDLLSLSRFCKLSGFRPDVRTLKPKCQNSYMEMLRSGRLLATYNNL